MVRLRRLNAASDATVAALVAKVLVVRVRDAGPADAQPLVAAIEDDDLGRVLIGIRLEHHAVHDAENRGVDADPEGETGDGDGGESGGLGQRAPGIAHILKEHRDLDGVGVPGSGFRVPGSVRGSRFGSGFRVQGSAQLRPSVRIGNEPTGNPEPGTEPLNREPNPAPGTPEPGTNPANRDSVQEPR